MAYFVEGDYGIRFELSEKAEHQRTRVGWLLFAICYLFAAVALIWFGFRRKSRTSKLARVV